MSKRLYESPTVPFKVTQSPELYASSWLYPVREHYLTRLWHPSPGLPSDSTCARGGLQSQVTSLLRKRVSEAGGKKILVTTFTTKSSLKKPNQNKNPNKKTPQPFPPNKKNPKQKTKINNKNPPQKQPTKTNDNKPQNSPKKTHPKKKQNKRPKLFWI